MSIKDVRANLQEYAKDIKINLGNVLTEEGSVGLSINQIYGIALSCVYTTKNESLINAVTDDVKTNLSQEEINAAKAASTIMAMNNIYYRSIHFLSDKEISKKQPGIRMNIIGNPGIDKIDFELYSLAISVINGCQYCVDAHAKKLANDGISRDGIQSTLRIAAVINATAQALSIN